MSDSFVDCVELFRGGRWAAAERAIESLLAREPRRAEAHHLKALIAARCERGADALLSFDAALALRPDVPELHLDRARALQVLHEPARALSGVDAAIRLRPEWWAALHLRGALLIELSRTDEALASLTQALALAPAGARAGLDCAIALLQGNLLQQAKRFAEAAASYRTAIQADPGCFDAHNNLGVVLSAQQRYGEAGEQFTHAIRLRPDVPEPYVNRAAIQRVLGQPAQALCDSESALALRPVFFVAHLERGLALRELGRLQEALAALDAAQALRPEHAGIHDARCAVLLDLGRPGDALHSFDQALRLDPSSAGILRNGAATLRELRRFDEALALAERAVALRPDDALAHSVRAAALTDLRRPAEALASADEALRLAPTLLAAQLNRASALADLERPAEALAASERAAHDHPAEARAQVMYGGLLAAAARTDQALEVLERALCLDPRSASAGFHAATTHLLAGRFKRGWELYESRLLPGSPVQVRGHRGERWRGDPLEGRRLLIQAEQGLGDTLQFCRYAALAAEQGSVILVVHDGLERLIASLSDRVQVIGMCEPPPAFDCHAPMLSMPLAFGTTLETIPARVPYLHAPADRVLRWRQALGSSGFRIGVAWQGSVGRVDIGRSFPLASLAPLADIPGVRLISLQKGAGREQLGAAGAVALETPGDDIDPQGHAFMDTAAIMQCCDLIVSSDTSIAHLAGALGQPAWIALKSCPDWRWMLGRADTPWYPTLRLFRQPRPGDWAHVFAAMANELRGRLTVQA